MGLSELMCAGWGDIGIISHGLSHKFKCIDLFSSVNVLGCVRLCRGCIFT